MTDLAPGFAYSYPAAINEAGRKIDAELQRKTQGLAGGLKLPGRP